MSPLPIHSGRFSTLLLGLFAFGLGSCASYPARTQAALTAFQRGHLERALAQYEDPEVTGSTFLGGAEAGTVALAMGDWELAKEHFHLAVDASEDVHGRGALESSNFLETVTSFGLNDTTQSYGGEGFERVYLHACLALSYLALGDLDGVWVEVQRGNQILEGEEELYEKEYQAGGFGHLISAVAYELLGSLDQAYIDYARMESKGVGTELAGKALVRIATQLNREDQLSNWEERYGPDPERPEGAANVVVLAGVGLGPFKAESSLAVPTNDGFLTMAVPTYLMHGQQVNALRLTENDSGQGVRTVVVEHVSSVAQENLGDGLALIAAKSIGRGILKRELTKHLEDEYGGGGRLVGDLFNLITERADLRAWQTLPDTWQAARLFVAPGIHSFGLEAIGGAYVDLGTFELDPGETMVVIARSVGPELYAHPIGGRPIGESLSSVDPGGEATTAP